MTYPRLSEWGIQKPSVLADNPEMPDRRHLPCDYCGGPKPAGKYRHAQWCSMLCKSRANEASPKRKAYLARPEIKERSRRQARAWYRQNRERALAHKKVDPSAIANNRHQASKRRARLEDIGGQISPRDWSRLQIRYRGQCAYCHQAQATEQDHVIPISRGGNHTIGNVLPACRPCNRSKQAHLLVEWRTRQQASELIDRLEKVERGLPETQ